MSSSWKIWIPSILVMLIAAALLVYGEFAGPSHGGIHSGAGGSGELFKMLGTAVPFLGAASFSWFWLKRKRKSPSSLVRHAARLLNKLHPYLGWAALALIAVHGTYFLLMKPGDDKIYTGLAAFALLLALAGYGWLIRKVRNKWTRTVHRTVAFLWAPALLLHAGGSAVLAVLLVLAFGALVWLLERAAGPRPHAAGPGSR